MERILTLTSNDFYTGTSAGAHVDKGGLWWKAEGVNTFVDTTASSTNAGLLQACEAPTDISSTLSGNPTDFAVDGTDMWFVSSGGDIGNVDLTAELSANIIETGTTNMGTGCEMFKPVGGTKYLYYFNNLTQIGRHDLATTEDDAWQTGLNSSLIRPIVKFKDQLYYGNGRTVGSISDDGLGAETHQANVLDLPADMNITALADDGTYLIVGATTNTGLNPTVYGNTRVFFWDTNSASWTREFEIPDTHIVAIRRVGNRVYAIGGRGFWVFSFQTRPYKIRSLDSAQTPSSTATNFHGSISSVNNAVLWGGGANSNVLSYGEMMQGIGVDNVYHHPFQYTTDNAITTMVVADAKVDRMYTGTANGNL